jgi:REP element-mobilizing transposase RayT
MANTYSSLFYHIVFSTKYRSNLIRPDIEQRVWAYIGGIARAHKMTAIQVGGIENHVHALISAKLVVAPSTIAQHLKAESSKWIHLEFPHLSEFGWQDGYGIFSVSKSKLPDVVEYIKKQREHHKVESFEAEYEHLMKLHGVDYDERYLLD